MSERTEEASAKKLREAQKKGQVVKSQDLVNSLVFMIACIVLFKTSTWIFTEIVKYYHILLSHLPTSKATLLATTQFVDVTLWTFIIPAIILMIKTIIPISAASFLVAIISNISISGFVFTTEPMMPNLSKFNPITNIQQKFSMRSLIENIKTFIKFILITFVVYKKLKSPELLIRIIYLYTTPISHSIFIIAKIVKDIITTTIWVMLLFGIFDYIYQRMQFAKEMMMTKSEVKQEYKESEGDPRMKSERKRFGRELIFSADPEKIATAKVIITNPTHIAIALAYDMETIRIPIVVAKGTGELAHQIIAIGDQAKVPRITIPKLAHTLLYIAIDMHIPSNTFDVIAAIFYTIDKKQEDKHNNNDQLILDAKDVSVEYEPNLTH